MAKMKLRASERTTERTRSKMNMNKERDIGKDKEAETKVAGNPLKLAPEGFSSVSHNSSDRVHRILAPLRNEKGVKI